MGLMFLELPDRFEKISSGFHQPNPIFGKIPFLWILFFQLFSSKILKNTFWTPVTVLAGPGLGVIEKSISYSANDAGGSGEYEKIIFRPEKGAYPNGILDLENPTRSGFKGLTMFLASYWV